MTTNTNSNQCHYDGRRRVRYFNGMLLEDEEFRLEQDYLLARERRINRYLFGCGVVCGLEVEAGRGRSVTITPGLALDGNGEVIELCKELKVPLDQLCEPKAGDCGCPPAQPEGDTITRYLVLRYKEVGDSPVPVYLPGGDCERRTCENSRIREGFCVEFWSECPECDSCGAVGKPAKYESPKVAPAERQGKAWNVPSWLEQLLEQPTCPGCGCSTNAVVPLAKLTIRCGDAQPPPPPAEAAPGEASAEAARVGAVDERASAAVVVDMSECRRVVWSPRHLNVIACRLGEVARKLQGVAGVRGQVAALLQKAAHAPGPALASMTDLMAQVLDQHDSELVKLQSRLESSEQGMQRLLVQLKRAGKGNTKQLQKSLQELTFDEPDDPSEAEDESEDDRDDSSES